MRYLKIQKLQEEKQGKITKEAKEEFENNIIKILLPKISEEEIKEQLQKVEKTNKKNGDGQMYGLAVCDMLARENRIKRKNSEKIGERRGERRGKELGRKNGIIQVAQNLINMKISSEQIKKATGLTDEELEKLKSKI